MANGCTSLIAPRTSSRDQLADDAQKVTIQRVGQHIIPSRKATTQYLGAPGSPFAAGHMPNDIAVADMNGDGHPDLVIANPGAFHPAHNSPFATGSYPHYVFPDNKVITIGCGTPLRTRDERGAPEVCSARAAAGRHIRRSPTPLDPVPS